MNKQEQFIVLYRDHHADFCRFCSARSYGVISPEDLVSESYLRAFQGFDKILKTSAFKSYLFGIASNIVKNALRDRKQEVEVNTLKQELKVTPSEYSFDLSRLYEALTLLPEEMSEALTLFEISGFSIKEIAKIQDASISAIKQRLKRGREKLGVLLGVEVMHEKQHHQLSNTISLLL